MSLKITLKWGSCTDIAKIICESTFANITCLSRTHLMMNFSLHFFSV